MSDEPTPGPPWTILKLLRWTTNYFESQGIESARLDAELLLCHILETERIQLYAHFDRPLVQDELDAFRALVKRRAAREPTAYITGSRHYWDFELSVDPRVLIPRPDTETLIRAALDHLADDATDCIADIGTGSGAIALALATERPQLKIAATDHSDEALDVARENVESLQLDEVISLFAGDLLAAIPDDWLPLDMIVSNPPYVAESEREQLQAEILEYEPDQALFAGPDGLDVIRRLIAQGREALRPGGRLLFEIGHRQGERAQSLLADADFEAIDIIADYGDRDRVATARVPGGE